MSWLDASDYLTMDLAARERVHDLDATRSAASCEERAAARSTTLLSTGALVLGLFGLAGVTDCTAVTRDEAPVHGMPDAEDTAGGVER